MNCRALGRLFSVSPITDGCIQPRRQENQTANMESKTGENVRCKCYVPGVTRKELGNQIITNYYSQESQQQALLKFNNLLRNDKIINNKK